MKVTLSVIGALAVIFALVFIVGTLTDRHHTAASSIWINQPPRVVWRVVTDFADWPSWNPHVANVRRGGQVDGNETWLIEVASGEEPSEVLEKIRPSKMVTRVADPDLPYGGTWTWEIASDVRGCKVTITEKGEIYNPLKRFVSRYVLGHHSRQQDYLRALARNFGESREPWEAQ